MDILWLARKVGLCRPDSWHINAAATRTVARAFDVVCVGTQGTYAAWNCTSVLNWVIVQVVSA